MVKGISRQVIVVHAPEPKLFEQAIFILKEDALGKEGVTDDLLLQEAHCPLLPVIVHLAACLLCVWIIK